MVSGLCTIKTKIDSASSTIHNLIIIQVSKHSVMCIYDVLRRKCQLRMITELVINNDW